MFLGELLHKNDWIASVMKNNLRKHYSGMYIRQVQGLLDAYHRFVDALWRNKQIPTLPEIPHSSTLPFSCNVKAVK